MTAGNAFAFEISRFSVSEAEILEVELSKLSIEKPTPKMSTTCLRNSVKYGQNRSTESKRSEIQKIETISGISATVSARRRKKIPERPKRENLTAKDQRLDTRNGRAAIAERSKGS